jgi:multidrug efflux pump subunit AcrA (membrane-fusion protein)
MRSRIIGIAVFVIVLIGGVLAFNNYAVSSARPTTTFASMQAKAKSSNSVSAEGVVVPVQRATLAFKTGGRVTEILVSEGAVVKAGTPLARLDDAMLKAQVAQAEAAHAAAQAQLARVQAANAAQIQIVAAQLVRLEAGASKEELAVALARAQEATTALAQAQDSYDRLNWIGGLTEVKVRSALDAAGAANATALAEVARVKAGARPEDIAIARAQLDLLQGEAGKAEVRAAQAQVDQAKAALDLVKEMARDAVLIAPFDGTVAAINADVGQVVAPGTPTITFGNLSKLQIETTDLAEMDVAKVAVGQQVNVTLDALLGKTFQGQVVRVAPIASDRRGDKVFKVTIDLPESTDLRWGMTANAEIGMGK